ncbi:exportin-5 [Trichonephila clavipes]|nr:exportin-5 [Trichonephila clavipes]
MDAELERLNSEIIAIVNIILNPATSTNDRKVAHEFFDGFKETSPYCAKCGFSLIARSNPPAVRHCAYQLIEHYIKLHWNNINDDEKVWIKNSIMETLASGIGPVNEEEPHIKDAACKIVVEIIKREWPQQWTSLMEELDRLCRLGDTQVELVLLIFSRLADDIVQFQNVPEKRRKEIYTTLCSYLHDLFEFFLNTLTENSEKYLIKKKFNIKSTETMINYRLSQVTLDTLCAFVDWVHIDHIKSGPLIPTLCRLLGCPDIRLDAIKCLRDVVDRKGKNEDKKELLVLFEKNKLFELISALDMFNQDEYMFFKMLLQCLLALVSLLVNCIAQFSVEVPSNFSLFLSFVLKFTRHPSMVLSQTAQTIWSNIFRSPQLSSHELIIGLIPTLLRYDVEKLIRCGYPSKDDCLSCKYSMLEFDSDDEFEIAFYKCRADAAENVRVITKMLPKVTFSFGDALLSALLNGEGWKTILDNPIAKTDLEECWEAIVPYMDAVCGTLTKNTEIPEIKELASDALRLLNGVIDSTFDDLGVQSNILSCISSLFYFVTFQPELKVKIYEKIFSYLSCVTDNTKNKEVMNLKRHSTSLLIKFSLNYPDLLLDSNFIVRSLTDSGMVNQNCDQETSLRHKCLFYQAELTNLDAVPEKVTQLLENPNFPKSF